MERQRVLTVFFIAEVDDVDESLCPTEKKCHGVKNKYKFSLQHCALDTNTFEKNKLNGMDIIRSQVRNSNLYIIVCNDYQCTTHPRAIQSHVLCYLPTMRSRNSSTSRIQMFRRQSIENEIYLMFIE